MKTSFESVQEFVNTLGYETLTYKEMASEITITQENPGVYSKEGKGVVDGTVEVFYASKTTAESFILNCTEDSDKIIKVTELRVF